jgi:6-phosphogluconolactonase
MRARPCGLIGLVSFLSSFGCSSDDKPEPDKGGSDGGSAGASGATTGGQPVAGGGNPGAGTAGKGGAGATAGSAGSTVGGGAAGGAGATGGAGTAGGATLSGSPVVFVGGFGANYPLRVYDLDKTTGALTQRGSDVDAGTDPSYLALDPTRRHLYAANENDSADGGITALSIGADGKLTKLNHQTGSDKGFTYVAVDPSGKFVLGASYNGGSVSVFPIKADGSIGAEIDNVDFGADAKAHSIGFDQTGKYVLVPTLGAGQVQQLLLGEDGMLRPNTPPNVAAPSGAGPRHIAVHPNGKLVFVANELNSTLTPYQLSADGKLTAGTTVSSLPAGFSGSNKGAHVELSPDGRFVYASNRGHDSIAVFAADQSSGALTLVEHESTRGKTPREFDVDPNGDVLIVANQDSASLSVYKIEENGGLTPLGSPTASAPSPCAVQIHYLP